MKKILLMLVLQMLLSIPIYSQEIGVSNGVDYEVINTRYEWRYHSLCGFNDLGIAYAGKFKIEVRYYRQYYQGQVIRQWTRVVECGWTGECREP